MRKWLLFTAMTAALSLAAAGYAARGEAATLPPQGDTLKTYTLEGGRVTSAGTSIDCEVHEVPAEIGGAIRHWALIVPEIVDTVKEEESGVWFFSAEGVALRRAPLESKYEFQGVLFSPDQSAFIIQNGSSMRPDIFFQVYGQAPEMLAEIPGIRDDESPWVDASRFVMTRIDDVRTGPNYDDPEKNNTGKTYGERTSVVLFDAAKNATAVLKESTATRNFWFRQVVEGGKAVEGWEHYVESEGDWGDSEKEQTRDFRIDIPAAK